MMLYVVHGNTYYDGYGHIENIFGIYTKKDTAEAAKDLIIKELYKKEIARGWMTIVDDISGIYRRYKLGYFLRDILRYLHIQFHAFGIRGVLRLYLRVIVYQDEKLSETTVGGGFGTDNLSPHHRILLYSRIL